MSRLAVLTKKNLLRFIKNPKTLGFLVLIPVMYYLILGLVFGAVGTGATTTTYNVGWVDLDSTSATQPNYQLDNIYDIFNDKISAINLKNYSTLNSAFEAAESGDILSYVVFPEGFEEGLENRSKVNLAFYNNDSTTSSNYSIISFYNNLTTYFTEQFKVTNITAIGDAATILTNFSQFYYDSMLIINDGFLQGLDEGNFVNMTYFYRNSTTQQTTQAKLQYALSYLNSSIGATYQESSYLITLLNASIVNADPISILEYDIYFRGDVSPATKATLTNTINQVIKEFINYNPLDIELNLDEEPFKGKVINQITYSAPGYLLYGPMSILSFVLVVLTGEKKDGIFKRLSSTQVKNWEIILSNIFSSILLIFMQFAIGAGILAIFGWSPNFASIIDLVFGIGITMFLFSFFLLALSFALAPVFKDPDTAGGGVWIIIIPLAMVSGIFVPIELFGESMQLIASVLPTRFAVVALQNILLNGNSFLTSEVLLNWGLLILYSAIIFAIGIKLFNKFVRES
ncbi:MAG: ABC transporter permease subunit [Candidatus Lokiarchaeota archaeon]|nr:ABC transporter permease subunit [Candidatus Lokiarchaeota archaeon]